MEVEIKFPPTPRIWKEDDESSINSSHIFLQNYLSHSTRDLKSFTELRKSKIKTNKLSKSTKKLYSHKHLKKYYDLSKINSDYINQLKEESENNNVYSNIEKFLTEKDVVFEGFDLCDEVI